MALSIVQSGKGQPTGTAPSVTITLGSSPVPGNLQVALLNISQYQQARTPTPPGSGWTTIDNGTKNGNDAIYAFWREFAAGDKTSWVFAVSGTVEWHSGVMYEVAGANLASPVNQYAVNNAPSNQASVSSPSVTPSVIGTLALSFYLGDYGASHSVHVGSVSTGWTLDQDAVPSYHECAAASGNALTTDTATAISDTFTITNGTSAVTQLAATLLIAPAGATLAHPPRPIICGGVPIMTAATR